jgi:hypothetical protein
MVTNVNIAIIGTAGRDNDASYLSVEAFENMTDQVQNQLNCILEKLTDAEIATVKLKFISGGAAWADHTAIVLYNKMKKEYADAELTNITVNLSLHLPCPFDTKTCRYANNPCAAASNFYHFRFSKLCKIASLADIAGLVRRARTDPDICVHDYTSFHQRNRALISDLASNVSTATTVCYNYLLALTFSNDPELSRPTSTGTAQTWDMLESFTHCTRILLKVPTTLKPESV